MVKHMDNLSIVLRDYQRQFPAHAQIHTLGYLPQKNHAIHHAFTSFNFSLILQGEGFYGYDGGQEVLIKAPCVITQWPDTVMHYGPTPKTTGQGWWQELYLIYTPDQIPALTASGFINPQRRWWEVKNPGPFLHAVEQLLAMMKHAEEPAMADRIDRAAEMAVLESLQQGATLLGKPDKSILKIKTALERNYLQNHDVDMMASAEGLSPSVFRRVWKKHVGMPPQRYLIELRMSAARRMLSETKLNISEIAYKSGYSDPLYFSRLFHKTTGMSASTYRQNYRPSS